MSKDFIKSAINEAIEYIELVGQNSEIANDIISNLSEAFNQID